MTTLHTATTEKLAAFRAALLEYKEDYGCSYQELEEICEVSSTNIGNFVRGQQGLMGTSLYKISLATGIPL